MIMTIGEEKNHIQINNTGSFLTITSIRTNIRYINITTKSNYNLTKHQLNGIQNILNDTTLPCEKTVSKETNNKITKVLKLGQLSK